MNGKYITIGVLLALVLILIIAIIFKSNTSSADVAASFDACVAAGYEVMESSPRECRDGAGMLHRETVPAPTRTAAIEPVLTQSEARTLAIESEVCTNEGAVAGFESYNAQTGTWWYVLRAERQGCSPACVVHDTTREVEVNWRCTGLIRP